MKKGIVIRGGYGYTNFGDDALMKVLYDEFIIDKNDITFSCIFADYLRPMAPKAKFITSLNCYSDYSHLIYGGGTQFYSFKPKRNVVDKIIYAFKNFNIVLKKIKAKFVKENPCDYKNTKIGALGVGVGPFLHGANPIIEKNTSKLFNKMDFLAIRDSYSHNKCNEWGSKHLYATDICYGSHHPKFNKEDNNNKINRIGVIVRDWTETKEGDQYQRSLIENVISFRENGFEVTYIVFAEQKDLKWIAELNKLGEKFIIWNPNIDTIDGFIGQLNVFDLFITARYHGAVYSSLLRKPFITIEVEQKLELIHHVYKDSSYVWSYPFHKEKLVNYVHDINTNYDSFMDEIDRVTKLNIGKAMIMKKEFKDFITD